MDKVEDFKVRDAQVDYNKRYTYSDYMQWDDDTRWELIDGVPYMMSAPIYQHQELLGNMYLQFRAFLKGKACKVFIAPFDVRLSAGSTDDTVVKPDLVIICDHSKMMKTGYSGAPDMVVEILSPSTSNYDKITKFNKYLQAGIREYWIIDPIDKNLAVHLQNGKDYISRPYSHLEIVPVHVLEGCTIDLAEVFEGVN